MVNTPLKQNVCECTFRGSLPCPSCQWYRINVGDYGGEETLLILCFSCSLRRLRVQQRLPLTSVEAGARRDRVPRHRDVRHGSAALRDVQHRRSLPQCGEEYSRSTFKARTGCVSERLNSILLG